MPALPGDLPLPAGVAHVALMLLVNLSVYEEGAQRVAKTSNFLQTIAEAAEDVRCRSLARSVLDNVAHHAGLLTQLTTLRTLPKTLQKVNPRHMLATFAQLESGCTGCAPPATWPAAPRGPTIDGQPSSAFPLASNGPLLSRGPRCRPDWPC